MYLSNNPVPDQKKKTVCVGIAVADPLRSIGLQSILEDGLKLRTCVFLQGAKPQQCDPTVLIVDNSYDWENDAVTPFRNTVRHLPDAAIVLLARGDRLGWAHKALAAGARAVLPETAEVPEIRACIRAVLRGKTWIPRQAEMGADTQTPLPTATVSLAKRFTPKEREVLRWLTQGHSNREIATTMGIDEATVKAHLGRMLRKADASNRVELTLRALASEKDGPEEG